VILRNVRENVRIVIVADKEFAVLQLLWPTVSRPKIFFWLISTSRPTMDRLLLEKPARSNGNVLNFAPHHSLTLANIKNKRDICPCFFLIHAK
jgi:hypothetical protein